MRKLSPGIVRAIAVISVFIVTAALFSTWAPGAAGFTGVETPGKQQTNGLGFNTRTEWATCGGDVSEPSQTWYMAEGCTAEGYETWILIFNPENEKAYVTLEFMTASGRGNIFNATVEPYARSTVNVAGTIPGDYNVSTLVESSVPVICERAMYAPDREWAHVSAGATRTGTRWYMAEGCTRPSFDTWLLVLNPGSTEVSISTELQTQDFAEVCPGPVDTIPPGSRRSYNLADYAPDADVATLVDASGGVVCERSMYASDREWASCSLGVTETSSDWYFAEGCAAGDFETWILVQNPLSETTDINIEFQTENGPVQGPVDILPGKARKSYRINDYVKTYDVSTKVSGGPVVCERAVYASNRDWAHSNTGKVEPSAEWFLAEGCIGSDFETWILLQNPSTEQVDIELGFISEQGTGWVDNHVLAPKSRVSVDASLIVRICSNVNATASEIHGFSYHIASSRPVVCERAMYGCKKGALVRPMDGTPLYPFTKNESVACGHWPASSLDYPYFGAPRANGRLHAGIDIYPPAGVGAPVYAMKGGVVIRVEPFYTRYTGEVTYAVLVDHGDFVANYAELKQPGVERGDWIERGSMVGQISGTAQLHFEMYTPGTTSWAPWYGAQPANLLDPTGMMLDLYDIK